MPVVTVSFEVLFKCSDLDQNDVATRRWPRLNLKRNWIPFSISAFSSVNESCCLLQCSASSIVIKWTFVLTWWYCAFWSSVAHVTRESPRFTPPLLSLLQLSMSKESSVSPHFIRVVLFSRVPENRIYASASYFPDCSWRILKFLRGLLNIISILVQSNVCCIFIP